MYLYIIAEGSYKLNLGRVMVVERKNADAVVKLRSVVTAFRAQIVDEVVVFMFRLEELDDIVNVVAIDALDVGGRIAHCYYVIGNVWVLS